MADQPSKRARLELHTNGGSTLNSVDSDADADLNDIMNQPLVLRHKVRSLNVALSGRDDTISDLQNKNKTLTQQLSYTTAVLNQLLLQWSNVSNDCQHLYNTLAQYNDKIYSDQYEIGVTNITSLHKCIFNTPAAQHNTVSDDSETNQLINEYTANNSKLIQNIVNIVDNINKNTPVVPDANRLQSLLDDAHTQYKQLSTKLINISLQSSSTQQRLDDSIEALNDKTLQYNTLHKQYVRLKSDHEALRSRQSSIQSTLTNNTPNTNNNNNNNNSNNCDNNVVDQSVHQHLKQQLDEYKLRCDLRESEIIKLRESEQQLLSQLQSIQRQPASDQQVQHSKLYIHSIESAKSLKRQLNDKELNIQQYRHDIAMLQQSHSRTSDIHQHHMDSTSMQYRDSVRKYQNELNELRDQLLSCTAKLEVANNKLNKHGEFADDAFERRTLLLQTLQSQNSQLQTELNALKSETQWCSTKIKSSQYNDLSFIRHVFYSELRAQLRQAEIKQSDLERQLSTYSRLSNDVTKHVHAIGALKAERDTTQRELTKLKQQQSDIQSYIAKSDDTQKTLAEFRHRVDAYDSEVESMRNALDSTADEFNQLQNTNSKLMSLQVQQDHTIQQLHQLSMQQQLQPNAAKIASELYNNKLKHLADELKHVNDALSGVRADSKLKDEQITQLQQQIQQLQLSMENDKQLVIAQQDQINESKAIRQSSQHQIDQLQHDIQQINNQYTQQTIACKSHTEQIAVLQSKYDKLNQQYRSLSSGNTSLASKGLQAELEQCKDKLKCSVCSINDKDTVLTTCYHAACAKCVEENLQSRNRKCGQCGMKFSRDNVKQLYLAN